MTITITGRLTQAGRSIVQPATVLFFGGDIGVFSGGAATSGSPGPFFNVMDQVNISSTGTATYFGDLSRAKGSGSEMSNGASDRGVFAGAYYSGPGYAVVSKMEFFTISNPANAENFGNMIEPRSIHAGFSNGTSDRGIHFGGYIPGQTNTIDYITISSEGNATLYGYFGEEAMYTSGLSNGINDTGVINVGNTVAAGNIKETWKITISSGSTASYFGELSEQRLQPAAISNDTNDRGVFGGGYNVSDTMDFITITTPGTAADYGNLTQARSYPSGASNGTNEIGVFAGGLADGVVLTIDYINFTNGPTANASSFGDLSEARGLAAGCSNSAA